MYIPGLERFVKTESDFEVQSHPSPSNIRNFEEEEGEGEEEFQNAELNISSTVSPIAPEMDLVFVNAIHPELSNDKRKKNSTANNRDQQI